MSESVLNPQQFDGWGEPQPLLYRKSARKRLRETSNDDADAARHAQFLREEAHSGGNDTERREFYSKEKRVRGGWAGALEAHERRERGKA